MLFKGAGLVKVVFIASLMIIFIQYFGIVSIKKYFERGVLVKVSKQSNPHGVIAPSTTICVLNPLTNVGWKNQVGDYEIDKTTTIIEAVCGGREAEDLEECVWNSTYDLNHFLPKDIIEGYPFIPDITVASVGKCFTLQASEDNRIYSNIGHGDHVLPLNDSFAYEIFVHDPSFFFLTLNPKAFPGFRISLKQKELQKGEMLLQTLEITEYKNMNRPGQHCTEDKNFNFSSCLRAKMESDIGCTMPWNFGKENMTGISECRTILQYEHFLKKYSLLATLELRDVIAKTKCPLPCNYRAIKPIGKPQSFRERGDFEEYASYGFTLVSTDIEVLTEEHINSFAELVSEMGGSL